jgi:hypothetical protein
VGAAARRSETAAGASRKDASKRRSGTSNPATILPEAVTAGARPYGTEGVNESEKNSSSGSLQRAVKSRLADSTTIGAPQA